MSAILVQSVVATGTSTAPAATFGSGTTAGNAIIAKAAWLAGGSNISTSGFTLDAGQTPAGEPHVAILSNLTATTGTTTVTGALSGASVRWIYCLEEWSGLTALDQTATAIGSGASGGTGTTSATTQANEMAAAAIAVDDGSNGDGEFSAATNGFTILANKTNGNPLGLCTLYKILSSTGAQSTAVTCSTFPDFYGVIATYKTGPSSPVITGTISAGTAALSLSTTESVPGTATLGAGNASLGWSALNEFPANFSLAPSVPALSLSAVESFTATTTLAAVPATASLTATEKALGNIGLAPSEPVLALTTYTQFPVNVGLVSGSSAASLTSVAYAGITGSLAASSASVSLTSSWSMPGGLLLATDPVTASFGATTKALATIGLLASSSAMQLGAGQSPYANFALVASQPVVSATTASTIGGVGFVLTASDAATSLTSAPSALATFSLIASSSTTGLTAGVTVGSLNLQAGQPAFSAQFTVKGLSTFALACAPATASLLAASVTGISGTWVYHIYANNGAGGPLNLTTPVFTTANTTWTTTVAKPSDTTWLVRTFDLSTGLEDQNGDARVTVVIGSTGTDLTDLPNAPSGLTVIPTAGGGALATWIYNPGGQGGAPTGFHLYSGTPSVSYTTPVTTVNYGSAYFGAGIAFHYQASFSGLTDGTVYEVGVRSFNATGEEPNTITASVTGAAAGPQPIPSLTLTLGT